MKKIYSSILIICSFVIVTSCNSDSNAPKEEPKSEKVNTIEVLQEFIFETNATFTGVLQELEYENATNTKMKTFFLILDKPINVISKNAEINSQNNVLEVQIGFSDEVKNPSSYLNKKITVTGEIYPEQTVNDRKPVVMINTIIKN